MYNINKPLYIGTNLFIMKTLTDLLLLIANETEMNKGKMCVYTFDLNTKYNWLSMYRDHNLEDIAVETVFSNMKIETIEQIQLAYWSIFNEGRSSKN